MHTSWNDPDTDVRNGGARLAGRRDRRTGRHRADRRWSPGWTSTPATTPGPEAGGADRARRARRLSGHRTVGGQPGRPGQPPAGRLSRCAGRRCSANSHPKIRVVTAALRLRRDRAGHLHRRRLHTRAGRRAGRRTPGGVPARRRRADRGHPACAVRLAETGWGDTSLTLPDGAWADRARPAAGSAAAVAGAGSVRRAAGRAAGARRCLSMSSPVVGAAARPGAPRRRRHAVPDDPLRRRLVAGRRRRPTRCALRLRPRRRPEGAARSPLAAPARRCARALAAVAARAGRLDRRRLAGPLDRGPGRSTNCTSARSRPTARSTRRSRSWTTWSISASTSSS